MVNLNDRQHFLEQFRRSVTKGTSKLEWAIQRGHLVKLWVGSAWPNEPEIASNPVIEADALIAFDSTVAAVFASGEIRISNGKIEQINIVEKTDFEGRMREPRRDR